MPCCFQFSFSLYNNNINKQQGASGGVNRNANKVFSVKKIEEKFFAFHHPFVKHQVCNLQWNLHCFDLLTVYVDANFPW